MPDNALFWLRGGVFFALLLAASIADLKSRIIPDSVCTAIALTGLCSFELESLVGLFCALPLLIAALLFEGMGGGDIKLMAAAGCVLGMCGGLTATCLGLSVWLLYYAAHRVITKLRKRKYQRQAYPVAPFLSIGCVSVYFLNQTGGWL